MKKVTKCTALILFVFIQSIQIYSKPLAFFFPIELKIDTAKGHILDALTQKPLASVSITVIGPDSSISHLQSDSKGYFNFEKMAHNSIYTVIAKKELYHEKKISIASVDSGTIDIQMGLEPIMSTNKIFTFDNILFEYRHYTLTKTDMHILDKVALVMLKNPSTIFELSAHTDARGEDHENMTLSENRAQATVYYLLSKGVHTDQLIAKGYGETMLKNKCINGVACTEEEHHINRRVEIKVVKHD